MTTADQTELARLQMALSLQGPRMWAIIACILAALSLVVASAAMALVLLRPVAVGQAAVAPGAASLQQQTALATVPQPASQAGPSAARMPTSSVRVASTGDGTVFSYDPGQELYFRMGRDGAVQQTQREAIPQAVLAQLDQATSAQSVEGLAASASQVTAQAQEAVSASQLAEEPLALNQLLAQPEVAEDFLAVLDRLTGVTVEGSRAGTHPVYAFFDPRCPYCHAAFRDLEGEVDVRWIPTLALGPGGEEIAATLLGPVSGVQGEGGTITSVTLDADDERVERVSRQLRADGEPMTITNQTLTAEQEFALAENLQVMRQLYGQQSALLGVPTFIVPAQDGTAMLLRGYDDENVALILDMTPEKEG